MCDLTNTVYIGKSEIMGESSSNTSFLCKHGLPISESQRYSPFLKDMRKKCVHFTWVKIKLDHIYNKPICKIYILHTYIRTYVWIFKTLKYKYNLRAFINTMYYLKLTFQ